MKPPSLGKSFEVTPKQLARFEAWAKSLDLPVHLTDASYFKWGFQVASGGYLKVTVEHTVICGDVDLSLDDDGAFLDPQLPRR